MSKNNLTKATENTIGTMIENCSNTKSLADLFAADQSDEILAAKKEGFIEASNIYEQKFRDLESRYAEAIESIREINAKKDALIDEMENYITELESKVPVEEEQPEQEEMTDFAKIVLRKYGENIIS